MEERPGWLREVVLYLTAQGVSQFGSGVVGFAVAWYIALKTGSGAQYAALLVTSSLAMAITAIPGGIWADRYWRKALMIGADGLVAVATAGLALVMLRGHEALWIIVIALAVRGLGGGIQSPAVSAALPQIVPVGKLMRVNSVNQAISAGIQVGSPALAGVLLTFWPIGWILLVDVVTAAIGIGITVFIRIPRVKLDPAAPQPEGILGYFAHLGEAIRHAARYPGLKRALWLGGLLLTIIVPFAQMTPVFVVRLFGDDKWMLAVVEATWSLGMVGGGLVIALWGGLRNRMALVMIACGVLSALTMGMGFAPTIWVFVAIMVAMGFALPMLSTPLITAIQELMPEAMMGRIMSVVTLLTTVCGPLGLAIAGVLSDHLSLSWMAFTCGGVGVILLVVMGLRGGPACRLYPPERHPAVVSAGH